MKGRKPELFADANALDASTKPPSWLSKHAKAEWRRVMPELAKRRILTTADLGSFESYCVAAGLVREIEASRAGSLDAKLFRMQLQAMQTAHRIAAELGCTPASRNRPAVRDNDDQDDDENPFNIV